MFKVNNGLSVPVVSENFHFIENNYDFRHQSKTKFKVDQVNTEKNSLQSVPKVWNSVPIEIINAKTLVGFKTKETYLLIRIILFI